jgi:hypothetical protein
MQGSSFIRSASEGTAKAQDNETREKGAVGLVPFFDGAHDKATAKSRDSPDRDLDRDDLEPDASAGWRAEYAHQHVDSEMIEK